MKVALHTSLEDWNAYYSMYNENNDDRLSRFELKKMMVDANMKHTTDCEVEFVHNIIAKFKNWITGPVFVAWAKSFRGRTSRKLIQYSQYLNILTMKMETPEKAEKRNRAETKFHRAIRGIEDESILDIMPDCVKALMTEYASLGETIILQAIR
jgi:hypothetical protein